MESDGQRGLASTLGISRSGYGGTSLLEGFPLASFLFLQLKFEFGGQYSPGTILGGDLCKKFNIILPFTAMVQLDCHF